jgi:F-type H+-transporting ATPase subunit a
MLAAVDLAGRMMKMICDHPWPGCRVQIAPGVYLTWMSSAIASILITTVVLMGIALYSARKHKYLPGGSANLLEVLVVFVRDMIARPALHDRAYEHLPFLMTTFVFVLGMNLLGIIPLEEITKLAGLPMIGHTATSIPTVCAALASLALLKIVLTGLATHAGRCRRTRGWPIVLCWLVSPVLWFAALAPKVPGLTGKLMTPVLAGFELIGVLSKCFALMVRLLANMLSGHTLLAVMLLFVFQAVEALVQTGSPNVIVVGPAAVAGSVVVNVLELLVAGLQAYIFTFLTAMFLGLYTAESH